MKIQVITKIPNPDKNAGNLCNETFVADICKTNKTPIFRPFRNSKEIINRTNFKIPVKLEVFHLAEIIIIDDNGREIGGWLRKASKWGVKYILFDVEDLDKAVKVSQKLLKNKL